MVGHVKFERHKGFSGVWGHAPPESPQTAEMHRNCHRTVTTFRIILKSYDPIRRTFLVPEGSLRVPLLMGLPCFLFTMETLWIFPRMPTLKSCLNCVSSTLAAHPLDRAMLQEKNNSVFRCQPEDWHIEV